MKKLVLHLGAHRCGSTAIQSLLRREHDALASEGIGVFLRADMVAGGFDLRRLHRFRRANPVWRAKLQKTARAIAAMQQQTLVVSEENIMGTMPAVRSNRFYPHFSNLVQSLVRLSEMSREPLAIAPRLVVRRQDHYLESVYAFRVSRGLALGFDDFIKTATRTRISWLRLAKTFDGAPPSIMPSIGVLEAWPKPTAAAQALAFLIGDNNIALSQSRLTGNTRRSSADLGLMLALNRARINWREAAWQQGVFEAPKDTGEQEHSAMSRLRPCLSAADLLRFEEHYSPSAKMTFTSDERAGFLAEYNEENMALMALPIVQGSPDVWLDG